MTFSIYEEAISEAKLIRESAEDKAKEKLIEAMTPKIKSLVESSLLNNTNNSEKEVISEDVVEKDHKGFISKRKLSEASREPAYDSDLFNEDVKSTIKYELIPESYVALNKLFNKDIKETLVKEKLENIKFNIEKLKSAQSHLTTESKSINRFNNIFNNIKSEFELLKTNDIITNNKELFENFLELNKEIEYMSKRQNENKLLNETLSSLFEADDELGSLNLADLDLEEKPEEGDEAEEQPEEQSEEQSEEQPEEQSEEQSEEMIPKEEVKDAIEGLMSELGLEIEPEEGEAEKEEEEATEETEEAPLDEAESVAEEEQVEGQACETDTMIEIDENMLRREIGKMKALRESRESISSEVSTEDSSLKESYNKKLQTVKSRLIKVNQAAEKVVRENRSLKSELAQTSKDLNEMKEQLAEMNLFNAKLLYANKLMQNRDLTLSQQKKIVEGLDNAKTMNEAKLLFESMSDSFKRPVNENASRRVLSSSSRAVSSAQTRVNESVELDRWAILAGLKR